jgi:predicted XRE-type DNA-binding protein
MAKLPAHDIGSGNIFADLGLPDSEELLLKAQIVSEIQDVMQRRKLTQIKTAALTGTSQPDLSNLLRGKFKGFTVDRLMKMLTALGRDVTITVRPTPKSRKVGGIRFKREAA